MFFNIDESNYVSYKYSSYSSSIKSLSNDAVKYTYWLNLNWFYYSSKKGLVLCLKISR